MASAGAITILADSFRATACGFVFVLFIVIGVATGTIGLICREGPTDQLRIAQVA